MQHHPNRSGKFVIGEHKALVDVLQFYIYWYEVDVTCFHTHERWNFDEDHKHDGLPGLTWTSEDSRLLLSQSITSFLQNSFTDDVLDMQWDSSDGRLHSQLSNIDFRYWQAECLCCITVACRLSPSTPLVRIEPSSPTDHKLLEYFNLVIRSSVAKPAKFPLRIDLPADEWTREYFFIGHGVKSVIVWRTRSPLSIREELYFLRSDEEPSEAQISRYQEFLEEIKWDEEKAKTEMK